MPVNDDFLQIYFIFARVCEFQKLFKKIKAKELLKEGSKGLINLFYYIKKESKVRCLNARI
jgi:hypothetical protein